MCMKRTLTLFFSTLLTASTAWATVEINEANFPDDVFRNWLLSQTYGTDGLITIDELIDVTNIYVYMMGITNQKGIEFFTQLTTLNCAQNRLTSLDLSQNKYIRELHCEGNQLTSLDLSGQEKLSYLYCGSNQLGSLIVSGSTTLQSVNCERNQLTKDAMDAFVESLPVVSSGFLKVCYDMYDQVMTTTQVAAAKEKGWTVQSTDNGYNWYDYEGVDPATGIRAITADETEGVYYDLNGTRLQRVPTQKGLYIKNGQKVVVK